VKRYVAATGIIFGLLAVVHVWRMVEEPHLVRDPWFLLVTATPAAFAVWAWLVSRRAGS
jgi:hypothetical protein